MIAGFKAESVKAEKARAEVKHTYIREKREHPSTMGGRIVLCTDATLSALLPHSQHLNDMIAKSKSMISCVSNLALSITDVATSSVNWSESETNDVELLNTLSSSELSSGEATSSPPNVMARVSTLFSSKVSALSNTPEALNLLLVEALDYEGSQMADFNLLCKHVDRLASLNDSHESTVNKLKGKRYAS